MAGAQPAIDPLRPGMGDLKAALARAIQFAEQVIKQADDARTFRQECQDLIKARVERVTAMLRQAARTDLYERPARRILEDTERALDKAGALLYRCRRRSLVSRVFTIIPAGSFKRTGYQLDNSIGDLSWVLRVSSYGSPDDDYIGMPPIAQNEPILFYIWEQIAMLQTGGLDARADAAASLVSLARDNDHYGKLIVEENGIPPLLWLVKEGLADAQESVALAIGLLARDPESVDVMILAGVCTSFAYILKDAPMKVQGMVAWAVSVLAANNPKCQDAFLRHNAVIRLLISHLAFETVKEHSKYAVASKMSIHSVVMDKKNINKCPPDATSSDERAAATVSAKPATMAGNRSSSLCVPATRQPNALLSVPSTARSREREHPEIKAYLKANAAKALCMLATGNAAVCKSLAESRALLCLSVLLEKSAGDVQHNSMMALVEICRVAEENAELRRSAFKPTSPAARAMVDQFLRVVEKAEYEDELLIPCITCLGYLSRTFRVTETRVIGPLVNLLQDDRDDEVTLAASVALTKFACEENYLHVVHSKAIIDHGGARHLVQMGFFRNEAVQTAAAVLVCYIAHHVPDSEELAQAGILTLLECAWKYGWTSRDPVIKKLLENAKTSVELYQSSSRAENNVVYPPDPFHRL